MVHDKSLALPVNTHASSGTRSSNKKSSEPSRSFNAIDYWILAGTALVLVASVFLVFKLEPYYEQLRAERLNSSWGIFLIVIGIVLLITGISFLLIMAILYFKYKSVPSVSDEMLPTCTVIVPAYNEGKLVFQTLMSLAESDYPTEKLELIAIDDGSKDDTWQWIQKARQILGDRVSIHQQPKNMGKRQALYRGFNLGTGEIFVTVDSDSVVKPNTLRNLVSPFVVNEKCGAVAGNVRVLNQQALIPKMVNVSFVFSFEFIRSAQSVLGSVFCTPGALSAYRRDAVMNCLQEWVNQKFMGQVSDIGEDRAMTNMILKQGFKVLFQRNALVLTDVPENYKNLYKMYIRWERSNVRENLMMNKFAFTNFREGSKFGTRMLLVYQWFRTLVAYPVMFLMFLFIFTHPILFLCSTLMGILIFSSVQVFFYAKRHKIAEAFWAFPYSIFYAFTLFWITPYAIATVSKNGWLTRTLPQKK